MKNKTSLIKFAAVAATILIVFLCGSGWFGVQAASRPIKRENIVGKYYANWRDDIGSEDIDIKEDNTFAQTYVSPKGRAQTNKGQWQYDVREEGAEVIFRDYKVYYEDGFEKLGFDRKRLTVKSLPVLTGVRRIVRGILSISRADQGWIFLVVDKEEGFTYIKQKETAVELNGSTPEVNDGAR